MTGRRIKQGRKCKVCGKELRNWNKSGLCSHHYKMKYWDEKRKERKKKHLCIMCGAKVKQITKHYAYDIRPPVKIYPTRCPKCQKRQNESLKKHNQKPKSKERVRLYYQKNKNKIKKYISKPEVKARRKKYLKEHRQKPEVKTRIKKYSQRPENRLKRKIYMKKYNQKPEVKEKKKIYQREKRKKARLIKNQPKI